MKKSAKKLRISRETLHPLAVQQAQGGTYTGELRGCPQTYGSNCSACESACAACIA
jgi:hypothetical protein